MGNNTLSLGKFSELSHDDLSGINGGSGPVGRLLEYALVKIMEYIFSLPADPNPGGTSPEPNCP